MEGQAALERTRRIETRKGLSVELRLSGNPGYEYSDSSRTITYATLDYCVFFPKQAQGVPEGSSRAYVCGAEHRETCGQACECSEERLGGVCVSAKRVDDYDLNWLKDAFRKRGVDGNDIVGKIEMFFPVYPEGLRRKGIGGGVLEEVVKDCRRAGFAGVWCGTMEANMALMLRNPRYGFEELRPFCAEEFVAAFDKKPADPVFRKMDGLTVRNSR
jgi:predicted GNAT family acetyltransferase